MVWLGRAVNHAGSGQAAGAGVGQMMAVLPGGNGGHGGHGLGGGGYGALGAGGATACRKEAAMARPQAAFSAWTMVERAPKPGGDVPARRAKRRSVASSGPRAQAGGAVGGRRGEDVGRLGDARSAHGARGPRAEQYLCEIRGLRAARAAVDDRHERDDGVPGLGARERDGHVVEAGRAGEGEAQRGPGSVGHGVAHLRDGDVELGRRGQAQPVALSRHGGCERDDERSEQDSAHPARDITATR